MTYDRLQELAASSVRLSQVLGQVRGAGLPETAGPDPLVHADASDAVLDEFLSLAVREAADAVATGAKPHIVFMSLAVSIPACVIERGVGEEALEYCLADKNLTPDNRWSIFKRMSRQERGPSESLRAAHRRIGNAAVRGGDSQWYEEFLKDNIEDLVDECPEDLADVMLHPRFSAGGMSVSCLALAIEHSKNFEPYAQRWIDWIAEERFDWLGPGQGFPWLMYRCLGGHRNNPRFHTVRVAAHAHLVHLLQSPDKVAQAWYNLCRGVLEQQYAAADELVTTIEDSGLRRNQLGSDALRYAFDALWELSQNPTGESQEFHDLLMLALQNRPTGAQ